MGNCHACGNQFNKTSRHVKCPSCRSKSYKKPCPICGLPKQRRSRYCRKCYVNSKQYPISKTKHISKDGYVYVYFRDHPNSDKEGRIYEHRLIMEEKLGRYLFQFENVHHKNGIRHDNRIENLELWIKTQPAGTRVEDVVKWAEEIISLYGGVSSTG